jgi:two-component system phosphate regulon response regulator PhoB
LRNIVFHFEDSPAFALALREGDQELTVPETEQVGDGEWVLAIFEVGQKSRATAAAARGIVSENGALAVLAFERRDWERLALFAEAGSVKMRAAPVSTASTAAPPARTSSTRIPATAPSSSRTPSSRTPRAGVSGGASAPSASKSSRGSGEHAAAKTKRSRASSGAAPEETGEGPPSGKTAAAQSTSTPSFAHWRASDPLAQGPSARILVVDDDRDIREVVGAMLDADGLTVESAMSAEEALERVRADSYDLLVLDWNLPGMTGIELCRLIRRDPKLSTLPVLFLTAHASSRDVVEAFAVGADDYVVKPFRAPELGARIFGLLRRARMAAPFA